MNKELSEIKSSEFNFFLSALYKIVKELNLKIRGSKGIMRLGSYHIIKIIFSTFSNLNQNSVEGRTTKAKILISVIKIKRIHSNMDKYYLERICLE